jgi:hypothetical protein
VFAAQIAPQALAFARRIDDAFELVIADIGSRPSLSAETATPSWVWKCIAEFTSGRPARTALCTP